MPASNTELPNASGLTANETKALSERQPQANEQGIIAALREMYECRPTKTTYDIYSQDAVFHDPIGLAKGRDSIAAQFNALPKLFPKATIPTMRILQNPSSVPQSTILIDQTVSYYRDPNAEPTKTINSLLTLETANGLVTRHTEEWDHKKETLKTDGFFGFLNEQRKAATAGLTNLFTDSKNPPSKS